MLAAADVRALALALPEAVEQDHHGRPSFRVGGRIFATLWTPEALNVMCSEGLIFAAAEQHPQACAPFRWGQRVRAVQVDLRRADAALVADLLDEAWARKAPKRLRPRPA